MAIVKIVALAPNSFEEVELTLEHQTQTVTLGSNEVFLLYGRFISKCYSMA